MVLLGNVIALIACLLMVYSGFIKKKKNILLIQSIQIGLSALSNILLGGFTGAIINALNCLRNILCYKNKLNIVWKIVITILSIVLSIVFNNKGLIGYLPLVSALIYLWLMGEKDVVKFKLLIIFTIAFWIVYDFVIKNYVSFAFDIGTIFANLISIYTIKKKVRS